MTTLSCSTALWEKPAWRFRSSPLEQGRFQLSWLATKGDRQRAVVKYAFERGVNWFDTAATYGNGRSEENLGRVLEELGNPRVYVATKVRLIGDDLADIGGAVRRSVEASLRRLRLPRLTLLQLHNSITVKRGEEPTSIVFNADLANNVLGIQRLGDGGQVAQMKCFNSIYPTASPTEDRLAVAESGAEIRIWNTTTWQPVRLVKSPADRRVYQIHFSADGQWLAAGCGGGVGGAWNLQSGEWLPLLHAESEQNCIVQCSSSRNILACAVFDNNVVELWDLDQVRRLERLVLDSGAHTICFSPDGRLLAVGETGMAISLWDPETGDKIDTLTGHTRPVTRLAFSPDGRTLVSGSYDETARLWNLATRRELFVLCRTSQFNWFGFVDGSLLVAHGRDNKLRVFPGRGSSTAATP